MWEIKKQVKQKGRRGVSKKGGEEMVEGEKEKERGRDGNGVGKMEDGEGNGGRRGRVEKM